MKSKTTTIKNLLKPALCVLVISSAFCSPAFTQRNCDKRESQYDICPIVAGPLKFDRCFPVIGDAACDALSNANKLKTYVEKTTGSQINALERDLNAFVDLVCKDAINEDALKKYREANQMMKEIDGEVRALINDPKFGAKGRIKALQSFFQQQSANIVAAGGVAASFGEAVSKAFPVGSELVKIGAETGKITASVTNASPEAKKQFETLKNAIEAITRDIQKIAALNAGDVIASGSLLVSSVGPVTVKCAACAGAIYSSIAGLGVGSAGGIAATAACPESVGVGCIVSAAGAVVSAGSSAIGDIAANGICSEVVKDFGKMNEYLASIAKFVNSVTQLGADLQKNLERTEKAVHALEALASQLKEDNGHSLKNIATSLNSIADHLEASVEVLNAKTLPLVKNLGNSFLQQLSVNTKDLVDCYKKYSATAGIVGSDVLSAAGDLAAAYASLLDVKKIYDNIVQQSQVGVTAAGNYIKNKKSGLDDRADKIYKSLFGTRIGVVDPGKIFTTITNIKVNPVGFLAKKARDASDLVADYAELVVKALVEGKKAFLNLDGNKRSFTKKTGIILAKATAAKQKLAVALAHRSKIKIDLTPTPVVSVLLPIPDLHLFKKIKRVGQL